MRAFLHLAAGALLVSATALSAQQTPTGSAQDPSVYQQQNPQDRSADQQQIESRDRQQQIENRDRDQNWNHDQQTHRDRDQNWNNGQYADQDRDRVNQYNQYDNGQNGTYSNQDRERARDRDQNGYTRQDQNGYNRQDDRERTYGYSGLPQNDQDNSTMTSAERSAWREGFQAGRADRQSGRSFSPNASSNQYRGTGQDEREYRLAFRQGYQRGYYGNNSNVRPYRR